MTAFDWESQPKLRIEAAVKACRLQLQGTETAFTAMDGRCAQVAVVSAALAALSGQLVVANAAIPEPARIIGIVAVALLVLSTAISVRALSFQGVHRSGQRQEFWESVMQAEEFASSKHQEEFLLVSEMLDIESRIEKNIELLLERKKNLDSAIYFVSISAALILILFFVALLKVLN